MISHLNVTFGPSLRLQRLSPVRAVPSHRVGLGAPCGLPVPSVASEHPLLWFSKDRPSTDIHSSRPVQSSPEGDHFGLTLLHVKHLPPLSFLPTSVVYSANCSTGLLHPAASHGVRAVSVWSSLPLCRHIGRSSQPFPGPFLTPFEVFPFLEAASRHRDRCHYAVTLSIVSNRPSLDFVALLLQKVRCLPLVFPLAVNPILPWALFPFKALPSFQLPFWTAPEPSRRSGLALDHGHRSVRILDVACTCVHARLTEASPSQL